MNSATGVIAGKPGNADVGNYTVNVTAKDGQKSVSRNFTLEVLNVNDPPEILSSDALSVKEDEPYDNSYEARDVDPTNDILTWSLKSNATWLNLTGNRLWGTPSNYDVGSFYVNISVSDGVGGTDFHNFTLAVLNVNGPPVITTHPLTEAVEDKEYIIDFDAKDVDAGDVLEWSLNTSAGWLKINSTSGVLSGTPENRDVGSVRVIVRVKDLAGAENSVDFNLTVLNVNDPPVWVSVPPDQNISEGDNLALNVSATDVDIGDNITYGLSSQPASNMTINPASGAIRWENAVSGIYSIRITATDGNVIIMNIFNITVNKLSQPVVLPPNNPPRIDVITVNKSRVGQAFTLKLKGSDPDSWDAVNLTFSLVSGPTGMVVSADGSILWIPTKDQIGKHTVTVALSDGKNSTRAGFDVGVIPAAAGGTTEDGAGSLLIWIILILIAGLICAAVVYAKLRMLPKAQNAQPQMPPPQPAQPPVAPPQAQSEQPPASAPPIEAPK
jgi:hypothetical protein